MTSLQITIDSAAAEALLEHLATNASHLQPTLNAIAHDITENIRLTFRDLQSPYGVPWKTLSPVTIKRRPGRSSVPLNNTGVLRNSIHYESSDYAVEIGTNAVQAATMNFGAKQGEFGKTRWGTPIPWGDIPARPFMPTEHLPITWETQILESIKFNLGIV